MPFPARVDCRSDHGGEPLLPVLHVGPSKVAMKAFVDRRDGRDSRYFKRLGEEATCIVRHERPCGRWAFAFCDSGPRSVQ